MRLIEGNAQHFPVITQADLPADVEEIPHHAQRAELFQPTSKLGKTSGCQLGEVEKDRCLV
jgi:hypothetical protein